MFSFLQAIVANLANTLSNTLQKSVTAFLKSQSSGAASRVKPFNLSGAAGAAGQLKGSGSGSSDNRSVESFTAQGTHTARLAASIAAALNRRQSVEAGSNHGIGSGNGSDQSGNQNGLLRTLSAMFQRIRGVSGGTGTEKSWMTLKPQPRQKTSTGLGSGMGVSGSGRWDRTKNRAGNVQTRYNNAIESVRNSRTRRGIQNWFAKNQRRLGANQSSGNQRLAAATTAAARAGTAGASASGKVATGLMAVAGKLFAIGSIVSAIVGIGSAALRFPATIAAWNDTRINERRRQGDYQGRIGAAAMRYDVTTQNIAALSARDTAVSFNNLVNQQNRLRKALRPWGDAFARFGNDFRANIAGGLASMLGGFTEATEWIGVAGAELGNAAGGKGFDPKRVEEAKRQAEKDREDKQRAENQTFDQPLSRTLRAWADSIDNKEEARHNRRPKKPIPPLR